MMSEADLPAKVTLAWLGDQRYRATNAAGAEIFLDSDRVAGLSPMESLLASVSGCMAIDVVMILEKMRLDLTSLHVEMEGERVETTPRYFRRVLFRFHIGGKVPKDKVERAIQLSFDKYCSVFHSLRKDLEVETSCTFDADDG